MNLIRMAKDNLIVQLKKYCIFIIIIALTTAIIFNSMNITMLPPLMIYLTDNYQLFLLALICICFALGCYSTHYFTIMKSKEISLLTISGASLLQSSIYIGTQTVITQTLGILLGLILGIIISPIYIILIRTFLNIDLKLFFISPQILCLTTFIIIIQSISSLFISLGFSYRNNIIDIMELDNAQELEDNRQLKFSCIVYFFQCLFGLIPVWYLAGTNTTLFLTISIFLYAKGILGIIKYWFPSIFKKLRDKAYLYHKELMIVLGNCRILLIRTSQLILIFLLGVILVESQVLDSDSQPPIQLLLCNIQLISLTFIIGFCLIFKLLIEINSRMKVHKTLKLLGYSNYSINKIIKHEVLVYYTFIALITFIPVLTILISSLSKGCITLKYSIIGVIPLFVLLLVLGVITYFLYNKKVKYQLGVDLNE